MRSDTQRPVSACSVPAPPERAPSELTLSDGCAHLRLGKQPIPHLLGFPARALASTQDLPNPAAYVVSDHASVGRQRGRTPRSWQSW
jgi:hypothetical protein